MAMTKKVTLIESKDKEPTIKVKAGQYVELVEIKSTDGQQTPKAIGLATLCGYETTYCISLTEVE